MLSVNISFTKNECILKNFFDAIIKRQKIAIICLKCSDWYFEYKGFLYKFLMYSLGFSVSVICSVKDTENFVSL